MALKFNFPWRRFGGKPTHSYPSGAGSWVYAWSAPVLNAGTGGGSATTIAYYTVKWGQTSGGPYDNAFQMADASTTTYTITGLASGTWYAVVTATNTDGVESDPSFEDTKAI